MRLGRKKLVESFYTSGIFKNPQEIGDYMHPEMELFWNSSQGFHKLNFSEILKMYSEMARSFESLRAEVSHLIREKNEVCIRFTYYIRTIENPDEEITMGHFIAIWKIKDRKMYQGYLISQPGDENAENLSSFISTNF